MELKVCWIKASKERLHEWQGVSLSTTHCVLCLDLTAGLAALDAADIVTNDTNIGNKLMDTTAMGIGGVLGAVGGPVGAMAGASTGKFVSDGLQWLFGDKKTPEQRKMEEMHLHSWEVES